MTMEVNSQAFKTGKGILLAYDFYHEELKPSRPDIHNALSAFLSTPQVGIPFVDGVRTFVDENVGVERFGSQSILNAIGSAPLFYRHLIGLVTQAEQLGLADRTQAAAIKRAIGNAIIGNISSIIDVTSNPKRQMDFDDFRIMLWLKVLKENDNIYQSLEPQVTHIHNKFWDALVVQAQPSMRRIGLNHEKLIEIAGYAPEGSTVHIEQALQKLEKTPDYNGKVGCLIEGVPQYVRLVLKAKVGEDVSQEKGTLLERFFQEGSRQVKPSGLPLYGFFRTVALECGHPSSSEILADMRALAQKFDQIMKVEPRGSVVSYSNGFTLDQIVAFAERLNGTDQKDEASTLLLSAAHEAVLTAQAAEQIYGPYGPSIMLGNEGAKILSRGGKESPNALEAQLQLSKLVEDRTRAFVARTLAS